MEIKVCDERRPGMTLTERLNNPQRRMPRDTDLVILDTLPTEADMREAARAMNGETVLRRALVNGIRRLSDTLKEANEICRSAHEIAKRDGAETNWEAFRNRLSVALTNQHSVMYQKSDSEQSR